jgi:M6 family metalloprotease-like protein
MLLFLTLAFFLLIPNAHTAPSTSNPPSFETLFSDDFSGDLAKWTTVQGTWALQSGYLTGESNNATSQISAGDKSWSDYILTLRARSTSGQTIAVFVRWLDSQNHYRIVLAAEHFDFWLRRNGTDILLYREASGGSPLNMRAWHEIRIKIYATDPTISIYVDQTPEMTIKDLSGKSIATGMIGLGVDARSSSAFDDVSVTTLHPDAYGPHSIIILLVEFPDVKHAMSPEEVQNDVFQTLNRYYTEVSYNLTWITGHVTVEWKILPQPSTYYDLATVTSGGWSKGRAVEIIKDSIYVWDSEVDFSQFDYVFIATAGDATWSYTEISMQLPTSDNAMLTQAVVIGRLGAREGWKVAAHELGHIFGLPDLYSYPIAYSGPSDWREAAVFVGPWDLMSRSDERPHIGAWGKIKLGWITPDRVFELLPRQQGAATVDPLERLSPGIQAIIIYLNSTTYFVIENRERVGFDAVLPDQGVLISYVDENRYWRGTGPVVVQDANPSSGPRWQLPHATFGVETGQHNLFMNQTYDLEALLLDKVGGSYTIAVGTPEAVNSAKQSYAQAKELIREAQILIKEATHYRSPDALALVNQALDQNEIALASLRAKTYEPFADAVNHANMTLALFSEAKQIELIQQPNVPQMPAGWMAIGGAIFALATVTVYVLRKGKRARSHD